MKREKAEESIEAVVRDWVKTAEAEIPKAKAAGLKPKSFIFIYGGVFKMLPHNITFYQFEQKVLPQIKSLLRLS